MTTEQSGGACTPPSFLSAELERMAFEHWYSYGGKWAKGLERDGDGYKYQDVNHLWRVWQVAVKSLAAEVRRLRSENAMLRTGDTCARLCEGTAYRIELCRLKRDVLAVMPENWREDEEWARLIEAHRLTPNAGNERTAD